MVLSKNKIRVDWDQSCHSSNHRIFQNSIGAILRVARSRAWGIHHGEGDFEWGRVFPDEMEMLCVMDCVIGEELENVCLAGDLISQSLG